MWQAHAHGLRVLLVLSSAAGPARGGISQYVRWWDPGGTAHDFLSQDRYKVGNIDWPAQKGLGLPLPSKSVKNTALEGNLNFRLGFT